MRERRATAAPTGGGRAVLVTLRFSKVTRCKSGTISSRATEETIPDKPRDTTMPMFNKILIANRGETAWLHPAHRPTRLPHRNLQRRTTPCTSRWAVTVYQHGPASSPSPTWNIAILNAAHRTGADAIHPATAFPPKTPDFCPGLRKRRPHLHRPQPRSHRPDGQQTPLKNRHAPTPASLHQGLPRPDQDDPTLQQQATHIGYPLMIKAERWRRGRGSAWYRTPTPCWNTRAPPRLKHKTPSAAPNSSLEQSPDRPRHVETNCSATPLQPDLPRRSDCSVQRRHQKGHQCRPAPSWPPSCAKPWAKPFSRPRASICRRRHWRFLLNRDGVYPGNEHRLQVEHPVTELITGPTSSPGNRAHRRRPTLPLSQEQVT